MLKQRFALIGVAIIVIVGFRLVQVPQRGTPLKPAASLDSEVSSSDTASDTESVDAAFAAHARNAEINDHGIVVKLLPDDTDGVRHQKFVLRLDSGLSVLVAHNTDIAPRISELREGDSIAFKGEYVWTPKGGIVHWTHHDRAGAHAPGWIRLNGRTYE